MIVVVVIPWANFLTIYGIGEWTLPTLSIASLHTPIMTTLGEGIS